MTQSSMQRLALIKNLALRIEKEKLLQKDVSDELLIAFRIQKLDLNSVPERKARIIRRKVEEFISNVIEESDAVDIEYLKDFKKKLIKRACRLYLQWMKQIRFKLFAAGERDLNILIPKS